jgi:hypothetical protein
MRESLKRGSRSVVGVEERCGRGCVTLWKRRSGVGEEERCGGGGALLDSMSVVGEEDRALWEMRVVYGEYRGGGAVWENRDVVEEEEDRCGRGGGMGVVEGNHEAIEGQSRSDRLWEN